ncbi:hypothetical protein HOG47_08620 [archaeon]|nr:hypothetical protein [archaeon]
MAKTLGEFVNEHIEDIKTGHTVDWNSIEKLTGLNQNAWETAGIEVLRYHETGNTIKAAVPFELIKAFEPDPDKLDTLRPAIQSIVASNATQGSLWWDPESFGEPISILEAVNGNHRYHLFQEEPFQDQMDRAVYKIHLTEDAKWKEDYILKDTTGRMKLGPYRVAERLVNYWASDETTNQFVLADILEALDSAASTRVENLALRAAGRIEAVPNFIEPAKEAIKKIDEWISEYDLTHRTAKIHLNAYTTLKEIDDEWVKNLNVPPNFFVRANDKLSGVPDNGESEKSIGSFELFQDRYQDLLVWMIKCATNYADNRSLNRVADTIAAHYALGPDKLSNLLDVEPIGDTAIELVREFQTARKANLPIVDRTDELNGDVVLSDKGHYIITKGNAVLTDKRYGTDMPLQVILGKGIVEVKKNQYLKIISENADIAHIKPGKLFFGVKPGVVRKRDTMSRNQDQVDNFYSRLLRTPIAEQRIFQTIEMYKSMNGGIHSKKINMTPIEIALVSGVDLSSTTQILDYLKEQKIISIEATNTIKLTENYGDVFETVMNSTGNPFKLGLSPYEFGNYVTTNGETTHLARQMNSQETCEKLRISAPAYSTDDWTTQASCESCFDGIEGAIISATDLFNVPDNYDIAFDPTLLDQMDSEDLVYFSIANPNDPQNSMITGYSSWDEAAITLSPNFSQGKTQLTGKKYLGHILELVEDGQ